MTADNPLLILEHPTLGDLPARRVLACIFALTGEGKILHFHREQTSTDTDTDPVDHDASGRESRSLLHYPPHSAGF